MKTPLTYGALIAIASALLTFALFFAGYHSDPEKVETATRLGGLAGIAIGIVGICLGISARRKETPPHEEFSYGKALLAGLLTGVFAAVFVNLFNAIYFSFINPGLMDIILQAQTAKLEAQGLKPEQIEAGMKIGRIFTHPVVQFIFGVIGQTVMSLVISLIAAAFFKRRGTPTEPPAVPVA